MLQECSILQVAAIFFNEPTKSHYLMEISIKSQIAHTSVKNYLHQLQKQHIIQETIEKKGKRNFPLYHAHLNHNKYQKYKQIYNLIQLEESSLISFLKDQCMPKSIILFGSYFRGEDLEDSDIDIFIESKYEKLDIAKFEKQLNRKIQLHFKEKFQSYPKELKNNILNGLIMSGYLEVF